MAENFAFETQEFSALRRWRQLDDYCRKRRSAGYIGAYWYRYDNRLILNIMDGTGVDNGDEITDQYYATGPLKIRVKLPDGVKGTSVKLLVSGRTAPRGSGLTVEFEIPSLNNHELTIIE